MANQEPGSRVDRTGGDATKAELVSVAETPKTKWDLLNHKGPGRTTEEG